MNIHVYTWIFMVVLRLFIDISFFPLKKIDFFVDQPQTLGKNGFYICHCCHDISTFYQDTDYLIGDVRTRHQLFIYGHSIKLSTAIKYDPYFASLAWMMYTMMRDKPSFAMLNLLKWFANNQHTLSYLHIIHGPCMIFMVLFVSGKLFL